VTVEQSRSVAIGADGIKFFVGKIDEVGFLVFVIWTRIVGEVFSVKIVWLLESGHRSVIDTGR